MKRSHLVFGFSVAVALILSSCETGSAPGGSAGASAPAAAGTPDGRKLYYGRCTSCHAPDPVGDYTKAEWRGILAEMAPKAKLTGAERSAVTAYVMAHAADS